MELFSAIKRRINEELNDALLALAQIEFYQSENHLDILVFCFSDQAYNITKAIKNIIYEWIKNLIKINILSNYKILI